MGFQDRDDAGRQLALQLAAYRNADAVVLALPRGGVPVAVPVARALSAPLDVLIVRKIGAPEQPELGIGALAEGGVMYLDRQMIYVVGATTEHIERTVAHERAEIERRVRRWRSGRAPVSVAGRTVIVVDDGIATGSTVRAALRALRERKPAKIVLAVPVAPVDTLQSLATDVDDIVCLLRVERLWSVGEWYADFRQVSDETVAAELARTHELRAKPRATSEAARSQDRGNKAPLR